MSNANYRDDTFPVSPPDEFDDEELAPTPVHGKPARKPRKNSNASMSTDKRASHNAIERARRGSLNDRFVILAQALPALARVKRPSKSNIVNGALDFVFYSQVKEHALVTENNALRQQVDQLRAQVGLEPLPAPTPLPSATPVLPFRNIADMSFPATANDDAVSNASLSPDDALSYSPLNERWEFAPRRASITTNASSYSAQRSLTPPTAGSPSSFPEESPLHFHTQPHLLLQQQNPLHPFDFNHLLHQHHPALEHFDPFSNYSVVGHEINHAGLNKVDYVSPAARIGVEAGWATLGGPFSNLGPLTGLESSQLDFQQRYFMAATGAALCQ